MFTYFLVGCTTSLYNIRNMHASTAPPNNMRINSNDEGDSLLVIRIWRLSPIPIMIVRCVHLHYHGTMKACQEKLIALILQRKQYIYQVKYMYSSMSGSIFQICKMSLKTIFLVLLPVGSTSLLGLANIYVVERETPLDKATYSYPWEKTGSGR